MHAAILYRNPNKINRNSIKDNRNLKKENRKTKQVSENKNNASKKYSDCSENVICDTSDILNPYRPGANIYDDYVVYEKKRHSGDYNYGHHLGGYIEAPMILPCTPPTIITRYRNPILIQTERDCARTSRWYNESYCHNESYWPGICPQNVVIQHPCNIITPTSSCFITQTDSCSLPINICGPISPVVCNRSLLYNL